MKPGRQSATNGTQAAARMKRSNEPQSREEGRDFPRASLRSSRLCGSLERASIEDDRAVAAEEDAVFENELERTGQSEFFDFAASLGEVFWSVGMVDRQH